VRDLWEDVQTAGQPEAAQVRHELTHARTRARAPCVSSLSADPLTVLCLSVPQMWLAVIRLHRATARTDRFLL
jgi:hypothetical protein